MKVSEAGNEGRNRSWSEVMSSSRPGTSGMTGSEPAAITKRSAPSGIPSTSTMWGSLKRAVPIATRMPRRSRSAASSRWLSTTWRWRRCTASQSRRTPVARVPKVTLSRVCRWARPAATSAFLGMQPRLTHRPPSGPRSARATRAPRSAAVLAAVMPAAPAPITTRSKRSIPLRSDREAGAGEGGGPVGEQERDHVRHVRGADPAGAVGVGHRPTVGRRVHGARQHRVHRDALGPHLLGQGLGEGDDRRLGDGVGDEATLGRQHRPGGDVDDAAPAARDHAGQDRPAGDDRGGEVELHHALPLRKRRRHQVPAREAAHRVDEAADLTEAIPCGGHELAHRALVGDVGRGGQQARAVLGGEPALERGALLGHRVGDRHARRARVEQGGGDRLAERAGAAGDDRDAAGHGAGRAWWRACSSARRARSKSRLVMPPASWVVRSITTRLYTLNHSGWCWSASASRATSPMNAKAWAKSAKVSSRWSLPPAIDQPGRADRREAISAGASLVGRGTRSPRRHGHDGRALDVLVAHLGDVEGLDVVDQLPERLLEPGQRLALAGEGGGAREHVVLHVRMVDAALLDPGHRAAQRLVRLADQRRALLALLERLGEVALQELVHPAKDRRERPAREPLVLLVEQAERDEVSRLELERVVLLSGGRLLVDQSAV